MTNILTHPAENFDFPPIGTTARGGFIDEEIAREAAPVESNELDDMQLVSVALIRTADNSPMFVEPILDYRIAVNVGERDEDISFYDLDNAERFALQILAAVAAAKADHTANAGFLAEAVSA
ncbi:hypothetical protein [Gordonia sp. SL306]|uniref:hypothetical protein n=1 Tax=Gordonia sp. SL306 TaxID=2995145 RepID=UPI00226F2E60|nr:hypothetical protein [Gordonia sp. SL306]WAC54275.1 hypothetical protein OVA31_16480 [Gordonia sp. SL306]